MWAPNLDEQFRVLKGGASSVSSGTTVTYSPFVEPKTGAPIPGDQFQISKPGISDALLRQTVISWANSPESGLSQNQSIALIEFARRGIVPSQETKAMVCDALKKLTAPETINRLGISSEDVQSLLSHVRTLQPVPESLADATTFYRDKIGPANGYTTPEMKYRDGLGQISATDSNIQTILDEMMKSGELRKGMSEKEIAKAVTTYVQRNFEYIADGVTVEGKSGDHWNSISETIAAKGGDCEDLSVVLASLMMGALSRSGYSEAEIHQKVTIAAGYVVNKAGAAKGHATVKLDLDDGSALALDATSDKAPFSFDWLKMDVVLEGNDQVFKQYGAIDTLFETAAEAKYFDVEGTIHSINEKLVELKDMLAAPVEVPLASSDGKSYTYYDTVTQTNKDISQHPGWDGSKVDFGFYTLEKKRVEDFGGTWHSDMFVTYFNEDKFFEFMSESRDLINRAVMLFHVVNMTLEYDEHQASEIAVSGFEEHEKAELLETMDSTQKFKNRFVNAMNNSLTKISSGIESVVNEMFIFVSGNNGSQEARVRAEIQAYGREDIATGILSALADELSGAFSFVRATAGLELSGIMSEINLANAQAYARYVKDFSENIALWDVNHLTDKQKAGQTNTKSFYNFGRAAVSNMQGFSAKNNKQALQNILDRGLDQLDALSGRFNDRTSSFSAKVGVSENDTNEKTASVENNNLNIIGRSGDQGQYAEMGYNYILRVRDYMVNYQNFIRSTYMITEAENNAKRQAAEQISATSGLQEGAKSTSSTSQTKGVVVNAMQTELQRQYAGLTQVELAVRGFTDSANGYVTGRYEYARWYKELAVKVQTGLEIAAKSAAAAYGPVASLTAFFASFPVFNIIIPPVILTDPVGQKLYSDLVGDYWSTVVPDVAAAAFNLIAEGIYYDLEVNKIKEKNTTLMVQDGAYGDSENAEYLAQYKAMARNNSSAINPYDSDTQDFYVGKMESLLYDARTRFDSGSTGDKSIDAGGGQSYTLTDGVNHETKMRTTDFMVNRGDGKMVLQGAAMASNQLGASTDYMKVSIYLSIMKVLQDAMEGAIAQMFGRGKTNTVSNFDSQIDAIVNKESSILDAFRYENSARMSAINTQQAKETRIQNQTISLARAGAKLGLHTARAIGDAFFVFFPIIFAESALYLSYVAIENAVKVAGALEEASVMMATAFGKFGFYNIDYHNDSTPYSSPAADPTFEARLASADPDKYNYPTTSYDDIYKNLNMSKQLFPEPVSAATKERVAKQYGPYSRMDEEEALILDGINNFSKNDPDSILTSSSDMLGIGGDFRQIDFDRLLEAYKAMTKINQIRTFMTMIDQAMYNAKQNSLRAMFGGNAGGGHGALSVMASGIDRYTTSIMGSMAGQTGIFQDFMFEAQGRMESVNDYTLGAINLSVEGTIKGVALLAQGIAGLRAYSAAATLAATGGLTIDTYNKKVGRMFNGVATAAMLASVAKTAVGVTMMKSVIANHPKITSELLNYEEDDTVEGANPADTAEAQRQNAKLKGNPAESSINFDPKNPSNTHNTDAAKPNYGLSGSGSVESQGVKQRVNLGDQARMERMVSRKSRQIQVLRDIALAMSDAKGDAAEDMGGGPAAKNAYRLMNSIINQQTNLEQQAVSMIFKALQAQVDQFNRGVDMMLSGVTGAVTEGLKMAAQSLRQSANEKDNKATTQQNTKTAGSTKAPSASAAKAATTKPPTADAGDDGDAPTVDTSNKSASVDSSSKSNESSARQLMISAKNMFSLNFSSATLRMFANRLEDLAPLLAIGLVEAIAQSMGGSAYAVQNPYFGLESTDYLEGDGNLQQTGGEASGTKETAGAAKAGAEGAASGSMGASVGFLDSTQLETAMFANALLSAGYTFLAQQYQDVSGHYQNAGRAFAERLKDKTKEGLKNRAEAKAEEKDEKTTEKLVRNEDKATLKDKVLGLMQPNPTMQTRMTPWNVATGKAIPGMSMSEMRVLRKAISAEQVNLKDEAAAYNKQLAADQKEGKRTTDQEKTVTHDDVANAVVKNLREQAVNAAVAKDVRAAGNSSVGEMGSRGASLKAVVAAREAAEGVDDIVAIASKSKANVSPDKIKEAKEISTQLKVLSGAGSGSKEGFVMAGKALGVDAATLTKVTDGLEKKGLLGNKTLETATPEFKKKSAEEREAHVLESFAKSTGTEAAALSHELKQLAKSIALAADTKGFVEQVDGLRKRVSALTDSLKEGIANSVGAATGALTADGKRIQLVDAEGQRQTSANAVAAIDAQLSASDKALGVVIDEAHKSGDPAGFKAPAIRVSADGSKPPILVGNPSEEVRKGDASAVVLDRPAAVGDRRESITVIIPGNSGGATPLEVAAQQGKQVAAQTIPHVVAERDALRAQVAAAAHASDEMRNKLRGLDQQVATLDARARGPVAELAHTRDQIAQKQAELDHVTATKERDVAALGVAKDGLTQAKAERTAAANPSEAARDLRLQAAQNRERALDIRQGLAVDAAARKENLAEAKRLELEAKRFEKEAKQADKGVLSPAALDRLRRAQGQVSGLEHDVTRLSEAVEGHGTHIDQLKGELKELRDREAILAVQAAPDTSARIGAVQEGLQTAHEEKHAAEVVLAVKQQRLAVASPVGPGDLMEQIKATQARALAVKNQQEKLAALSQDRPEEIEVHALKMIEAAAKAKSTASERRERIRERIDTLESQGVSVADIGQAKKGLALAKFNLRRQELAIDEAFRAREEALTQVIETKKSKPDEAVRAEIKELRQRIAKLESTVRLYQGVKRSQDEARRDLANAQQQLVEARQQLDPGGAALRKARQDLATLQQEKESAKAAAQVQFKQRTDALETRIRLGRELAREKGQLALVDRHIKAADVDTARGHKILAAAGERLQAREKVEQERRQLGSELIKLRLQERRLQRQYNETAYGKAEAEAKPLEATVSGLGGRIKTLETEERALADQAKARLVATQLVAKSVVDIAQMVAVQRALKTPIAVGEAGPDRRRSIVVGGAPLAGSVAVKVAVPGSHHEVEASVEPGLVGADRKLTDKALESEIGVVAQQHLQDTAIQAGAAAASKLAVVVTGADGKTTVRDLAQTDDLNKYIAVNMTDGAQTRTVLIEKGVHADLGSDAIQKHFGVDLSDPAAVRFRVADEHKELVSRREAAFASVSQLRTAKVLEMVDGNPVLRSLAEGEALDKFEAHTIKERDHLGQEIEGTERILLVPVDKGAIRLNLDDARTQEAIATAYGKVAADGGFVATGESKVYLQRQAKIDLDRDLVVALTKVTEDLKGIQSYFLGLEVSQRLSATTVDQAGLNDQDTRTALAVLKANGLDEGGATAATSVFRGFVRGLTLNMVDYDARGGFRAGSGPIPWQFGKFAKAISDSTGRQALDEKKLALLRHTDAELEAMPEDPARKIRDFKSQLTTKLTDAFGDGEIGQAKAAQVIDVLTGKARKDAVERLHVLTNADRMAVRQRDDLDKHLDDARSMGNEWAYTSTMEVVRNLEAVGLKSRQAELEKMSYAFKENALNRSDLSNVIYRSFIDGKLQHEIRQERDDTYIAETRGYDRRAAAIAFADLTDTALNRSRFQDRGGALAKQMKDAQDKLKKLDSILLTGKRSRAVFGTDLEGAGWAKKTAVTAFNMLMNKNEELIETGTPGKPEQDFATDLAKQRDLQLDMMMHTEKVFRAEVMTLVVSGENRRVAEMIKGALNMGAEGQEMVARLLQGFATQDSAYGSALFKVVSEAMVDRYSGDHATMASFGEALVKAVEPSDASTRKVKAQIRGAGLAKEEVGPIRWIWRAGERILAEPIVDGKGRATTETQVADAYLESLSPDLQRAVTGRGVLGRMVDAALSREQVAIAEPITDTSRIETIEARMASAVGSQLTSVRGLGKVLIHMDEAHMQTMMTSIKPAVQAELVEMIATGSSQIGELYRSHSAMTDVAAQFDAAQKRVEASQGDTRNPITLLEQRRAGQQLQETTEKLDLTVTGYADMSMRKAGDVLKNGLESNDLSPESWARAREAAATMIMDSAKRIRVLQDGLRGGHGVDPIGEMASGNINDRMTEFARAIRAIDLPAGNPNDATRAKALLAIRDAVDDVVRPHQEALGRPAILDVDAVRPVFPGSYAQTLREMNIDASQQIQHINDRRYDLEARIMTQAERAGASLLQGLTEARRDPSMVTVPTNESMVVLHKMTKALGESAIAVVPGELRARLQQADADSVPDVIIELNRIIDQGLTRPMRLAAMQEQMQERQRYAADYSGDTKVSVNSDFSSLDRKLLTDGPRAMVELNKRANGVLRHVVELSASGDFGSINQLLGNIRRTGGTAGDLVIQMVAYEVRRLGKQQQFETYLKSSDARTEQFVKTLSEDKKAQQEAKAKFAESLRRDEAPTDEQGEPLTLLGNEQVQDVQASFDRNEALATVAVQLNADPKKLEGILSDPSGATKLAQLLAQGVALNLPGAHRILEQLLQKESQGMDKLGFYLGDAIRKIDEKSGGPSGITEEVQRVLEKAIKETEKKEKSSVADHSNKKEGFINAIKSGYQGDRKLVWLSRQDRVTTTSKAMVTGGVAAIDKTRADFQNFAKVDPNGAAVLIKDLHAVNQNHANTLLEGMMKNLDSAALPGMSRALATVSVDADISPETKTFVNTLKATIDQQLAEDVGKQGTTLSHGLVTAALVGGRTEFAAEVTARATELQKAGIAGPMGALITEMATNGVLSKDQLAEFSAGIDGLPVDQQSIARELAHFAMAKADLNQFLMSHVAAGTRSDNSTLVSNDTMRPKLEAALSDATVPLEMRMDAAVTLANVMPRSAVMNELGAAFAGLADAARVGGGAEQLQMMGELVKFGSSSATAISAHIAANGGFPELAAMLRPESEKFRDMTPADQRAYMGSPDSMQLAAQSPSTYVDFLTSDKAVGVANPHADGIRQIFGAPPQDRGIAVMNLLSSNPTPQQIDALIIADAASKELIIADAASKGLTIADVASKGLIAAGIQAASVSDGATVAQFQAGCRDVAADIANRVVTGDLGKLSIGASESLAHAGQIVSQQAANLGENLMRLARDIESKVDKKESYMGELHQFSEKLLTAGPVGELYAKGLGAVEGTGPQAACTGLAVLIATLDSHPNAIMNQTQVISTLGKAFAAHIAAGVMKRSDS